MNEKQITSDYTAIERCLMREFGLGYGAAMSVLRRRDVKVNGKRVAKGTSVRAGDTVCVYAQIARSATVSVVYQDDNVVVIDKPTGMDVIQATQALSALNARAVHRLDTNTTGLMIFARNEQAEQELLDCFRSGRVDKRYSAVVFGRPQSASARWDEYLLKDADKGLVRIVPTPRAGALTVSTAYALVESNGERSLLDVTLYTGRTHQIRAHLSYHGLPVVGDGKYGDFEKNRLAGKRKQLLKCVYLCFAAKGPLSYLAEKEFCLPPLTLQD